MRPPQPASVVQPVSPTACVCPILWWQILTVLINVSIWDKHASLEGLTALFLCLGAAAAYQQSPFRKEVVEERERMLQTDESTLQPLGRADASEAEELPPSKC